MAQIKVFSVDEIECGGETITGDELRAILTKRVHNPDGNIVRIDGIVHDVAATRKALKLYDILRSIPCDHSVGHAGSPVAHNRIIR